MSKSDNKTVPTTHSPEAFIASVENERRRADAETLLAFFNKETGLQPVMWGPSIIGYGRYQYQYESGRAGEFMLTGFSPRKQNMSVYILPGYRFGEMQDLLSKLGKHKLGKSCLYINKLADIELDVLADIVRQGMNYMRQNYTTFDS